MLSELAPTESWVTEEWTGRLVSAIELMAGERPGVSTRVLASPPDLSAPPGSPTPPEIWRQPFPPLAGSVWIATYAGSAEAVGAYVLRALGVEDGGEAEQNSTFEEIRSQALAGLAQALTTRLKREVNPAGGAETRLAGFPPAKWVEVTLRLESPAGDKSVTLQTGFETTLIDAIRTAEEPSSLGPEPPPAAVAPAPRSPLDNSKTFALLLEVELPVAVSFGRAQIPLKDVLKLTTGSIVELNRAVTEPVDIIVNNCVIARGEVVVVEGNFGVRIQEVITRQDRLRTVQ